MDLILQVVFLYVFSYFPQDVLEAPLFGLPSEGSLIGCPAGHGFRGKGTPALEYPERPLNRNDHILEAGEVNLGEGEKEYKKAQDESHHIAIGGHPARG
jgi:hypothetical protein